MINGSSTTPGNLGEPEILICEALLSGISVGSQEPGIKSVPILQSGNPINSQVGVAPVGQVNVKPVGHAGAPLVHVGAIGKQTPGASPLLVWHAGIPNVQT